jgi:GTP diphosphokinase / guanosine-3',5'-bis(diphosphate) 3'-diphosphatase
MIDTHLDSQPEETHANSTTSENSSQEQPPATIVLSATPQQIERLHRSVAAYLSEEDSATIQRILPFASEIAPTSDTTRIMVETGTILAEMHVDVTGVAAGMLQFLATDPVTMTVIPTINDQIIGAFGYDVSYLIENIAHFNSIERRKGKRVSNAPRASDLKLPDRRSREREDQARRIQIETVRKMFMAMGDDPRVVIFRLADHLRQMRHHSQSIEEIRILSQEARDIYAPLAGRLGMSRYEAELDDLAFARLEPEDYRRTKNLVDQVRSEQKTYIDRVCTMLKNEAAKIQITAEISGRYKHLWSIYRKLLRNGWDIHQVYDLIAFRVLVPNEADCYAVLGQVHALWQPKEDRIKDFIAHPKPNGYQSLHTTVFCLDNRLAEIQIRTHEMHQNAEFGVATHWYYKDIGDNARADKKLSGWLQQLRDWQSDLQQRTTSEEFIASSREEGGTRAQVFVFTPHGDVKDLPYGATPIDFAYRIHSNLGDHCAGARIITPGATVTHRMVPLDYVLNNGEIVEIMVRKDAHPTRGWLNFVRTTAARQHINRYLKQHEKSIYITIGRERFERDARQVGINSIADIGEEVLRTVADTLHYESVDEMFAAVGGDALRTSVIMQEIAGHIEMSLTPATGAPPKPAETSLTSSEVVLDMAGARGLMGHLASCCHPLPGDPVVGYISRGRGIVVHHQRCRSLKRLENERFLNVDWSQLRLDRYEAAVIAFGRDRTGLLRDVTHQVQDMKINMGNVCTTTNRKGQATITLTLHINVPRQLDDAINRIRSIKDITGVGRDDRCLVPIGE